MHAAAINFFSSHLRNLSAGHVLEFGSLNVNGSVRDYYPQALSWWGVDIIGGQGVDEIQDAADWRSHRRFDVVVCAEVFEHTPRWSEIVINMHRHLVDGGLLLASCASRDRPPHGATTDFPGINEYYENIDPSSMRELLSTMAWQECDVIEADGHFGNDDLYVRCIKSGQ